MGLLKRLCYKESLAAIGSVQGFCFFEYCVWFFTCCRIERFIGVFLLLVMQLIAIQSFQAAITTKSQSIHEKLPMEPFLNPIIPILPHTIYHPKNSLIPTPGTTVALKPHQGPDKTATQSFAVFRLSLVTFFGEQRK
ncbi:hypothetical protein LX64_01989 [Chitinophaga skermanii]|uniref:Uncharacterized protein n=1 Tax=Chitinophaga skermanii TaxID=331697 RepID=A0A327QRI2_9BACT|nr:hypothetical protein LX64_01989 [Chitinophaga skermanii]